MADVATVLGSIVSGLLGLVLGCKEVMQAEVAHSVVYLVGTRERGELENLR